MLRREDIDGVETGRAIVLAFVELELDGAVKRDRGEGGAGVCLCDDAVVCVWVLEESVEVIAVLIPVLVPSLSSSGEPDAIALAVVAEAPAGECHVGGRRRGSDDCCFGGIARAADLREPDDEPPPGVKV